jgi:hypothetical protein
VNNPYLAPAETPAHDLNAPSPYGSGMGAMQPVTGDRSEVSELALDILKQTRPWVMFLSVMSFIGSAFMLFGGIIIMVAGAFVPARNGASVPTAMLGAVYIPMSLLYIYPALKLWGFGSAIGRLLTSRAGVDLEAALRQQKSFWKFAGITTLVLIALYIVFFIGLVAVGVSAAGRH